MIFLIEPCLLIFQLPEKHFTLASYRRVDATVYNTSVAYMMMMYPKLFAKTPTRNLRELSPPSRGVNGWR